MLNSFLHCLGCFVIAALAAKPIGQLFTRFKFPLITGYLATGIIIGPFVLNIISIEATEMLRFIDDVALAFIAFAAGSELYLKELKSRLKSIAWVTVGLVLATFTMGSLAVFLLGDYISFMEEMSTEMRLAVAILAGSILVARSPSSAIAIVKELRARGPYTQTALGVTVVMDVAVIVLFSVNTSVADAILTNFSFDLFFIILLVAELFLAIVLGTVLWKILDLVLMSSLSLNMKSALVLLIGYGVFVMSATIRMLTHDNLPFEVLLEPLLICMIGGFLVTNLSGCRDEFLQILHNWGPSIYIIFFTLTGASLALDILVTMWPIALILLGVRLTSIFLGSFVGGMMAGDPMRHNRLGWMAYITQAGVGLGLAKEVAIEFPEWGAAFATMIISVIVLNQIIGPPFFKLAIRRVEESHLPESDHSPSGQTRDALILGVDAQSLTLARQLKTHNWQVIMADTNALNIERLKVEDVDERFIPEITADTMASLLTQSTDAVIAMLDDDAANLRVCELAYENFGTKRLIVRLNDLAWAEQFQALGARIVNPISAMVHLLDQFTRAPQSADVLLHRDPEYEITQVTVTNADVQGIVLPDLRLPLDVLILCITRNGHSLEPHNHICLNLYDVVTLWGHPDSLEDIILRWGF